MNLTTGNKFYDVNVNDTPPKEKRKAPKQITRQVRKINQLYLKKYPCVTDVEKPESKKALV
jgi:hypothetical protein